MRKAIWLVLALCLLASTLYASEDVALVASKHIGLGETKDNDGPFVLSITNGKRVAWCAAFVSHVLYECGYKSIGYNLRARDIWNKGTRVKNPKPGDIICFSRGKNPCLGHVGIVYAVTKDRITTIEGNTGKPPSIVKYKIYDRKNIPNLLGYVRVEK